MSDDWDDIRRQMLGFYAPDHTSTERYDSPLDLAQAIEPMTIRTPALELINEFLIELMQTPDGRGIICMSPQEGKTTMIRRLIEWILRDTPDTRITVATNTASLAREMGGAIREDIKDHIATLGLRLRRDVAARAEFKLLGRRGGVYAVGVGGSLTGRSVDLLIIDDPIKNRAQADSQVFRDNVWDWWTSTASTRLPPGGHVVVVLTRWHEDDLAGRLLTGPDKDRWRLVSIPAQADHDPNKGETDPLGRDPGQFMQSANVDQKTRLPRTDAQWEAVKVEKGSRDWTAMYQQRPAPAEGNILKREWFERHWYDGPMWLESNGQRFTLDRDVTLIQSWDLAFKDTSKSDYVCGQVWMRRGVHCYLLDQVHGRFDFVATCAEIRKLSARWPQATAKIIEDAANGPAVRAALDQAVGGIIPEVPQGSKESRTSAIAPLLEAGNVHVPAPEVAAWVTDLIEEAAGFPYAKHDDRVDAMSQALNRLVLQPLFAGEQLVTMEDLDPDLDDYQYVPAY